MYDIDVYDPADQQNLREWLGWEPVEQVVVDSRLVAVLDGA